VNQELLLPRTELGILQTLEIAETPMRAGEIAEELDCSYQLIGKRARNLEDRQLVTRDLDDEGKRSFSLTDLARSSYFDPTISSDLQVDE
jgi:DNA-binding MarR family transcriptional regulator